jgi:serine/threonine-protein kinase
MVHPVSGPGVALSPDGARIAYAANKDGRTQIYVRALDRLEAKAIPGTAGGAAPFFSPDGQWLAFRQVAGGRTLNKVALGGGAPLTVAEAENFNGGDWGADGQLIFTKAYPGPLVRVAVAGGETRDVTSLDIKKEHTTHFVPAYLPGGNAVLFTIGAGGMDSYDDAQIAVASIATGDVNVLVQGGTAPQYSPSGHLIYARNGTLFAARFDPSRMALTGPPVTVLDGVLMCAATGTAHYRLTPAGSLIYAPGRDLGGDRRVVWVDRRGNEQSLPLPGRSYLHPRLSPDGRQLAIEIEGPTHNFWTYDFQRGAMTKMSLDGLSHAPLWTPDGSRITYRIWQPGGFKMWWMPADHSGAQQRLTDIGIMQSASSWSPDGRFLAFTQVNIDTGPDVYLLDVQDGKPRPLVQTRFAEGAPRFSPDGAWIAYASNESGRNEVYVQAWPGPGARIQISTDGGTDAVWRRAGGELYYRNGDKMMVVSTSARSFSKPAMLWQRAYAHGLGSACGAPGTTSAGYDVTPDGQRFLMLKDDESTPGQIHVVLNWAEEVKRLYKERTEQR